MRVVFHGGTNPQKGRGIRVEYHFQEMKCGGVLTGESGHFSHEAVTGPTEENCEWIIEASKGKHIQLNLHFWRWNIVKCSQEDVDVDVYSNDTSEGGQLLMR